MDGLEGIINQLEAQKTAIERALEALREVGGEAESTPAPSAVTPGDKRSAAQKARWAKKRGAEAAKSAASAKRKGGMTEEGRQKLSEAMKSRWAAKRTEPKAKKGPGRPRKVVAEA